VGPYQVVLLLGRGMSEVYRATDTRLGRDVALKVVGEAFGAHGPALERFEREARLAASLSHPNVVALYDVGVHDRQPYFVTELLQGQTLRERLTQGSVPVPTALEWTVQAAQGLAAVHERGIVHRDLKPENLFITRLGQVKLLDFGIAKIVEAAQEAAVPRGLNEETRSPMGGNTTTGTVVGTPGYMAPEQVQGQHADVRADVFSLGAVLHEMLTGHRAFPGSSLVEAGYAILHAEPEPLGPEVPGPVVQVVRRCLEKEPARRFQNVHELVEALRAAGGSTPLPANAATLSAPFRRRMSLRRRLLPVWIFAALALVVGALVLHRSWRDDAFWRNPLENARFQALTDSEEPERFATISPDGKLVAFLSARDGPMDVWLQRLGSGEAVNATRGRVPEIAFNRGVRMLRFSPEGDLIALWLAKSDRLKRPIETWAIPVLRGEPRRFRSGIAEVDWSPDGRQRVFHGTVDKDPTFVEGSEGDARQIFETERKEKHAHFQTWSPDGQFIYFVRGEIPNGGPQDIWRIRPSGGEPERITFHDSQVTHPTFLDRSTLLYLATAPDGEGPFIYGIDVNRRVPHRLSSGVTTYASLAASAEGRRLVVTTAQLRTSLWRAPVGEHSSSAADVTRVKLPTAQGRWPRLGPDFLLYVSSSGGTDRLWKIAGDTSTELWTSPGPRILGPPAISPAGDRIAFSTGDGSRRRLLVMNMDGTGLSTITGRVALRGGPAWAPDAKSLVTAADEGGGPHLVRIDAATGEVTRLVEEYALDPAWAPGGDFLVYSGPDVGTMFPVRAVTDTGQPHPLPELQLNRGARRFRFFPGQTALVVMSGDIEHKELVMRDLASGGGRPLTNFGRDILMDDFDLSPDGRSLVFERVQERSDIVLIERAAR
jgi:serine/threonine protein kinase